jgi:hypothetical protein
MLATLLSTARPSFEVIVNNGGSAGAAARVTVRVLSTPPVVLFVAEFHKYILNSLAPSDNSTSAGEESSITFTSRLLLYSKYCLPVSPVTVMLVLLTPFATELPALDVIE